MPAPSVLNPMLQSMAVWRLVSHPHLKSTLARNYSRLGMCSNDVGCACGCAVTCRRWCCVIVVLLLYLCAVIVSYSVFLWSCCLVCVGVGPNGVCLRVFVALWAVPSVPLCFFYCWPALTDEFKYDVLCLPGGPPKEEAAEE